MTEIPLRSQVRATLGDLLQTELDPTRDDTPLAEIAPGRYDSLGVLDAVGAVETRFDVVIDVVDDDLRTTFASVASIAALVTRKRHDAAVLGSAL
jgi:acyl carrier protein